MTKKQIIAISVSILGLGLLSYAVWGRSGSKFVAVAPPADIKKASTKEVTDYLASDSFGKLSDDQKIAYMDQLRKERKDFQGPPPVVSEEQRERIHRNIGPVFQKRMEKEIEDFFKLPADQQNAFLDQRIDQMQAAMKSGGPMGPSGGPPGGGPGMGRGPGGPPPRPNHAMMRRMIEHSNPTQRARMATFMKAMQKRMKERGINPPPPPR